MASVVTELTAMRGVGRLCRAVRWLMLSGAFWLAAGLAPAAAQQAPTVAVTFTPPQVVVGGSKTTTVTITVTNPNAVPIAIDLADVYPAGLVLDTDESDTCITITAPANGGGTGGFTPTSFTSNSAALPAGVTCEITLQMHAASVGSITDTVTETGGTAPLADPASGSLFVTAFEVPSLGSWGLLGFGLLLGAAFYRAVRRQDA